MKHSVLLAKSHYHIVKRAEMLSKELGKKIFYIDTPQEDTRKGMKKIAMENWFIDATMWEFNCIVRGWVMHRKTTTVVEQITG